MSIEINNNSVLFENNKTNKGSSVWNIVKWIKTTSSTLLGVLALNSSSALANNQDIESTIEDISENFEFIIDSEKNSTNEFWFIEIKKKRLDFILEEDPDFGDEISDIFYKFHEKYKDFPYENNINEPIGISEILKTEEGKKLLNKYEILANSYFNLTIDNESLSRDLDFLKREMRRSSFNKSIDENYKSIISKQGNLNLTLVWFVIFLILTNILTILRYKKYKNENDS